MASPSSCDITTSSPMLPEPPWPLKIQRDSARPIKIHGHLYSRISLTTAIDSRLIGTYGVVCDSSSSPTVIRNRLSYAATSSDLTCGQI
ncbi:unnamed protein product [Cochlearia groenlandica]